MDLRSSVGERPRWLLDVKVCFFFSFLSFFLSLFCWSRCVCSFLFFLSLFCSCSVVAAFGYQGVCVQGVCGQGVCVPLVCVPLDSVKCLPRRGEMSRGGCQGVCGGWGCQGVRRGEGMCECTHGCRGVSCVCVRA